jgi:hypothetical protein
MILVWWGREVCEEHPEMSLKRQWRGTDKHLLATLLYKTFYSPYELVSAWNIRKEMVIQTEGMLLEIMSWDRSLWGRLAGGSVYCAGTDPVDSWPKAKPREQRGLTLYTLASRLQKQKAKLNRICLHVTLLAISFPQCYVTFMFQFFKFYLSALRSPPPCLVVRTQPVSFLASFLLPWTKVRKCEKECNDCLKNLTYFI